MRSCKRRAGLCIRPLAERQWGDHPLPEKSASAPPPRAAGPGRPGLGVPPPARRAGRLCPGGRAGWRRGGGGGRQSLLQVRAQPSPAEPRGGDVSPRAPCSAWVASAQVSRDSALHVPGGEAARRRLGKEGSPWRAPISSWSVRLSTCRPLHLLRCSHPVTLHLLLGSSWSELNVQMKRRRK